MIREADRLVVVDLAERRIDRQRVGQRRGLAGIDVFVEGMRVADQAALRMCQVGNRRVVRIRTRRGGERVGGVSRQQQVLREIQDAQMTPVAGVEFLAVQDQEPIGRCRIDVGAKSGDVGKSLLLVYDQVRDQIQVFGAALLGEVLRRVAIQAAVVHVHVQVAAPPRA